MKQILTALPVGGVLSGNAWAHGDFKKAAAKRTTIEEKTYVREGDPRKVTRNIPVDMSDNMRYAPMRIIVQRGETVRFVAKNSDKVMHEMVLGIMPELTKHLELMRTPPAWNTTNRIWRM